MQILTLPWLNMTPCSSLGVLDGFMKRVEVCHDVGGGKLLFFCEKIGMFSKYTGYFEGT